MDVGPFRIRWRGNAAAARAAGGGRADPPDGVDCGALKRSELPVKPFGLRPRRRRGRSVQLCARVRVRVWVRLCVRTRAPCVCEYVCAGVRMLGGLTPVSLWRVVGSWRH